MAMNAFLSFGDEASGESTHVGYEKWSEIRDWSWQAEAPAGRSLGGGAGRGKPTAGDLVWRQSFDTAVPAMLGRLCTGRHFPRAQIDVLKTTGDARPAPYLQVKLTDVRITQFTVSGDEEGAALVQGSLAFGGIELDYRAQDQRTGSLGAPVTFTWDLATGVVTP